MMKVVARCVTEALSTTCTRIVKAGGCLVVIAQQQLEHWQLKKLIALIVSYYV